MICTPVPPPWFLDAHSGAIQSLCAIAALVLVGFYTVFTWTIRQATVRLETASQRPLLVLEFEVARRDSAGIATAWDVYIENKGNGPALGVFWKVDEHNATGSAPHLWHEIGAIAVGDWSDLPSDTEAEIDKVPEIGIRP